MYIVLEIYFIICSQFANAYREFECFRALSTTKIMYADVNRSVNADVNCGLNHMNNTLAFNAGVIKQVTLKVYLVTCIIVGDTSVINCCHDIEKSHFAYVILRKNTQQ